MKKCGRCGAESEDFGTRSRNKNELKSWCRSCCSKDSKRLNAEIKAEAIQRYGGFCYCCGETEPLFLSLDHVENDGASKRRECGYGSGNNFYKWLKRNNWPALRLQVACHNCNLGRHVNGGVCPHQSRFLLLSRLIGRTSDFESEDEGSSPS